MKKVTLKDDSYWKLVEVKARLKCRTWEETIERVHELISAAQEGKELAIKGLLKGVGKSAVELQHEARGLRASRVR